VVSTAIPNANARLNILMAPRHFSGNIQAHYFFFNRNVQTGALISVIFLKLAKLSSLLVTKPSNMKKGRLPLLKK
jgi:hypothetical protein